MACATSSPSSRAPTAPARSRGVHRSRAGVTGASTVDRLLDDLARAPKRLPGARALLSAGRLLLEDRYLVGDFIDRGAMGEVYAGTDNKLKRRVAIKFLAERFRGEIPAVQR